MKINWFSPLPPSMTGIAEYTSILLPHLQMAGDVTLWTDQPGWDKTPAINARVRQFDFNRMPWRELNEADANFYNIGNNIRFHRAIHEVCRLHPGIVILHDFRLQDFFFGLYHDVLNDRKSFLTHMARCHGGEAFCEAQEQWKDNSNAVQMALRYPLTELALVNAVGTVVHAEEAFESARHFDKCPVACLPLPYAAEPVSMAGNSGKYARQSIYNLIVFGYLGSNRRLEILLKALQQFPDRRHFHLDIYGPIIHAAPVTSLVASPELRKIVSLHGHCPENRLHAALQNAHLAINLRNPTMGEASISQLRIWRYALPSLVTRLDWYAGLPANTVAFVEPDHELEGVHKHLSAFLADPESFRRMGESGYQHLKTVHNPGNYVRELMEFAVECRNFRGIRPLMNTMPERLAQIVDDWASPKTNPGFFSSLAHQLAALANGEPATKTDRDSTA